MSEESVRNREKKTFFFPRFKMRNSKLIHVYFTHKFKKGACQSIKQSKFSINPPPSLIHVSPPFQGNKFIKPPSLLCPPTSLPSPQVFLRQNDVLINQTVTLHKDWSSVIYSQAGSLDLFFIFGCMTSNFMCLSISTLHSSYL